MKKNPFNLKCFFLLCLFSLCFSLVFSQEKAVVIGKSKSGKVETILGYLNVYPEDLGKFKKSPDNVINAVNMQSLNGYDNWRLPTEEELSLMYANGDNLGLKGRNYMTRENNNDEKEYYVRLVNTNNTSTYTGGDSGSGGGTGLGSGKGNGGGVSYGTGNRGYTYMPDLTVSETGTVYVEVHVDTEGNVVEAHVINNSKYPTTITNPRIQADCISKAKTAKYRKGKEELRIIVFK